MDTHGHRNADSPESMAGDTNSTAANSVAATDTPSVTAGGGGSSFPATQNRRSVVVRVGRGMIQNSVMWGGNFMAHTIIIEPGEDIVLQILSLFGEDHVALMVYNATGTVSEAIVYQPVVQEFITIRDELTILSLIAIFRRCDCESTNMPGMYPNSKTEAGRPRGNLLVSLSASDGNILVDSLVRSLIAASPVHVVIGIFMPRAYEEPPPRENNSPNGISTTTALAPTQYTRSRTNPFDHLPHFNGPASSSSSS